MSSQNLYRQISRRVLRHYRTNKRELPWRENRDPYAVWISEIMLQQTRVATVIPYYNRWLRSFPTVEDLASAPADTVLSHWSGLGYYSRARNLHACAKELVVRYQGRLPSQARDLRNLPGIGRYTAGAISSIAYGQHEALVDGNVARLISRVFAIEEEVKSTKAIKKHWEICEALLPKSAPGDFNQGLMELGAQICHPRNPKCDTCPLLACCRAHQLGRVQDYPLISKRKRASEKPLLSFHALFLRRRGKILLGQRTRTGLFGGLWEFPQSALQQDLESLTGLTLEFPARLPALVHEQVLTHRRLKIEVWPAHASGRTKLSEDSPYQRLAWYRVQEISSIGISSATKAILLAHSKSVLPSFPSKARS